MYISLEKLEKVVEEKDTKEALLFLAREINEILNEFEKKESKNLEYLESSLYSKLIQKLVTKDEFKAESKRLETEIKRLDQKIDFVYNSLNSKIEEQSKKMEYMYKELSSKIDFQYQAFQSEIRRIEDKIKLLMVIILISFAVFNPYFLKLIQLFLSFIK